MSSATTSQDPQPELGTKICTKCNTPKSVDSFNFRNKKKRLRQSWCRICQHSSKGLVPIHPSDHQIQDQFARFGDIQMPSPSDLIATLAANAAEQVAGPGPRVAPQPAVVHAAPPAAVITAPEPSESSEPPVMERESALLMLADKLVAATERAARAEAQLDAAFKQVEVYRAQLASAQRAAELEARIVKLGEDVGTWQQLAEGHDLDMQKLRDENVRLQKELTEAKKPPTQVAIVRTYSDEEKRRLGPLGVPVGS